GLAAAAEELETPAPVAGRGPGSPPHPLSWPRRFATCVRHRPARPVRRRQRSVFAESPRRPPRRTEPVRHPTLARTIAAARRRREHLRPIHLPQPADHGADAPPDRGPAALGRGTDVV